MPEQDGRNENNAINEAPCDLSQGAFVIAICFKCIGVNAIVGSKKIKEYISIL